ncbi:hypothetical protein VTK73DRAFT_6417 [Phialemonium thermophilum]|uniref:O-methyltransferase n=1 Tax=Phialemonium thermophilum TaxID=223376 RepID=A0ABR3WK07_9PEZI
MKVATPVLYPTPEISDKVTEYAENHTMGIPQKLTDYHTWICETQPHANYCISTFQARSLVWLARLAGAKRVLEIGCYLGFSASVWSYAVGPEGTVTGLEFNEEYANTARTKLAGLGGIDNVEFKVGRAIDLLDTLNPSEPYDLIFIDADKSGYPGYLEKILALSPRDAASSGRTRLLKPGGLIVADNILRRAMVVDNTEANPFATTR